jgi:hypothetical protein
VPVPTEARPQTSTPAREQLAAKEIWKLSFWVGRLDYRPVAAFRMAFGFFLFYDLCDLLFDLRAWFSDEGVLPRSAFLGQWARTARFSLLDSFGNVTLAHIYWLITAVAVLCMAIGYRSRLASIASFVLMAGFQERLPPLFDGSDTVIRMLLFWHMVVPSNRVWSVDAILAERRGTPLDRLGPAFGVRLMQLQIAFIYLITACCKIPGHTWQQGDALHYVLHLNHVFSRSWALSVADNPFLMAVGTYYTLVLEFSFLPLVFFPIPKLNKWTRALAMSMAIAMHIGIAFTVNVGLFSYLMPITMMMFCEPEWSQWLVDKVGALLGKERLTKLQELAAKFPVPRGFEPPLASYFSETTLARARSLGTATVLVAFVSCTWYAIPKYLQPDIGRVSPTQRSAVETSVQALDVWSSWDMFSPEPLRTDYHLTAPVEYENGTRGNLFGGAPDGPGEVRGMWYTRWIKYFENVAGGGEVLPLEWGRYMCREHNFYLKPGESRVYTFTLFKDDQIIPPIGQPWPPVTRNTVWNHRCFDKPNPAANTGASTPRVATVPK